MQTRTFGGSSFGGSSFGSSSFGSSSYSLSPAARSAVTSPTATSMRGRLDPTTMNVPVFPGNTIFLQQGTLGFAPYVTFPADAGFGNTGYFIQQGGASSLQEVDPFGNTATPGPALNAVPYPAAPMLQPSPGGTYPVPLQNPVVPGQAVPATPAPGTPIQPVPIR